jgi:hypothetical protein
VLLELQGIKYSIEYEEVENDDDEEMRIFGNEKWRRKPCVTRPRRVWIFLNSDARHCTIIRYLVQLEYLDLLEVLKTCPALSNDVLSALALLLGL